MRREGVLGPGSDFLKESLHRNDFGGTDVFESRAGMSVERGERGQVELLCQSGHPRIGPTSIRSNRPTPLPNRQPT